MTNERTWVIATRVALAVVGIILAVLVVSGISLIYGYRPDFSPALARIQGVPPHLWTRAVHRIAADVLLPATVLLAIAAGGLARTRHRAARLTAPITAFVVALAAMFTGYLLPWDQLRLKAVTVGGKYSGYHDILFGHRITTVFVGNAEVAPATIARWFWIHVVVLPLLLLALLVVVLRQTRATSHSEHLGEVSSDGPRAL